MDSKELGTGFSGSVATFSAVFSRAAKSLLQAAKYSTNREVFLSHETFDFLLLSGIKYRRFVEYFCSA